MKKNRIATGTAYPILEQYRSEVERCVKCGACRAVCPSFLPNREESVSPRGRISLVKAVLDGKLDVTAVFQDRLATCMTCFACEATCASGVPVSEIIEAAREQAVAKSGPGLMKTIIARLLTHDKAMRASAWLAPLALHYSAASVKGTVRIPRLKQRERQVFPVEERIEQKHPLQKVLFFPGCTITYFQPDIAVAAKNVLSRIGCETIAPEGLKCCGRPMLGLGDRGALRELALHNSRIFSESGADAVVTACASCSLTFKKEYHKLHGLQTKLPVLLDIHEFLAARLADSALLPSERIVTWHDPCHLNRGQGLAKTARAILAKAPGVRLVEMKDADRCCGFGGVMRVTHRDLSDAVAAEKVKSIIATGAKTVITGCPGCRMQLREALRRAGSCAEVVHTVQLLEEQLR